MKEIGKSKFSRIFLILALFTILIFFCSTSIFSQDIDHGESITITTYYPAPHGVYRELITKGNTYLATDSEQKGNVGIGTRKPNPDAPGGTRTGNLEVNDVYIRSIDRWLSKLRTRVIQGEFNCVDTWTVIPNSTGAVFCALSRIDDDASTLFGTRLRVAGQHECEVGYDGHQWLYRAARPSPGDPPRVHCGYTCLFFE